MSLGTAELADWKPNRVDLRGVPRLVTLFAFSKPLGQPLAGTSKALSDKDLSKVAGAGFEPTTSRL